MSPGPRRADTAEPAAQPLEVVGAAVPALPDFVRRVPEGAYHSLNPITKLSLAGVGAIGALVVRGWSGPLAVLALVLLCAAAAQVLRRLLPFLLAALPLVVSIVAVNTFLYPDAHDRIATLGPLAPTWTGVAAALQATLRVVAFGLSAALFALTTPVDDLLVELERRGLGRRGAYVVGAAMTAVPRTLERARAVAEAQRARGLDTEGGLVRRARGLLPLAGPVVLGSLAEVEERTMALEARAFTAAGRRTLLRRLPDSGRQRALRWVALAATIALAACSLAGVVRLP
jgi:energy-coupling factor transport system permease protein